MKLLHFRSYGLLLMIVLTLMLEGCAGCTHRSRKARERHRNSVECKDARLERHRNKDLDVESGGNRKVKRDLYTVEFIETIAESEDYDKMLECQFAKLNEIKRLKDEYFRGNMPDMAVKERMQEIENKFEPIEKALNKANREGLLTYNQHKRQMKLMGDYIKVATNVANRLGTDLSSLLDI